MCRTRSKTLAYMYVLMHTRENQFTFIVLQLFIFMHGCWDFTNNYQKSKQSCKIQTNVVPWIFSHFLKCQIPPPPNTTLQKLCCGVKRMSRSRSTHCRSMLSTCVYVPLGFFTALCKTKCVCAHFTLFTCESSTLTQWPFSSRPQSIISIFVCSAQSWLSTKNTLAALSLKIHLDTWTWWKRLAWVQTEHRKRGRKDTWGTLKETL